MLLGKRPRPPMRRTTSMRALSAEELNLEVPGAGSAMAMAIDQKQQQQQHPGHHQGRASFSAGGYLQSQDQGPTATGGYNTSAAASAAAGGLSPRVITTRGRRPSADLMELSHFLRACSLCKRRIRPGRDIYMYRGDTACCSLECRQQKMNIDEKKEKCSMTSMKEAAPAGSESSGKGETVAAA